MYLPLVVLSVSTIAETVSRGFINFDYPPVLNDDIAVSDSEIHPVFLYSQNSQGPRRPQRQNTLSNNQRVQRAFPNPIFGFKPSMSQSHRREIKARGQDARSSERYHPHIPRLIQQATRSQPQYSVPNHGTETKHEGTKNTFDPYYRNFKDNSVPRQHIQSELSGNRHSNPESWLNIVSDRILQPTDRKSKPTHTARSQRHNLTTYSETASNPIHYGRLQKTILYLKPNPRSNSNDNVMHLKSNPGNRRPLSDVVSEVQSSEILTDFQGTVGKVGTDPIVVLPNPRSAIHEQSLILIEPSIFVTTNRPDSAPRGFRTRPQHVEDSVDYQISTKESNSPKAVPKESSFKKQLAKEIYALNAQGSHRLEQTDRNLYYKSDPFLDITEVYSLPRTKDEERTTHKSERQLHHDINLYYKNHSSAAITEVYSSPKKNTNDIKLVSTTHRPEVTGTNLYYYNDSSVGLTEVYSRQGNATKSKLANRTTPRRPNSYSVDKKLDDRKKKLKTFRKKAKVLEREDESSIPGTPGSDYPTYQEVPFTNFNCKSSGFYADIEARCQVFHNCDTGMQRHSFLCPNGTVFRQELLICDWWYNVRCEDAKDFFPTQLD